MNEALIRREAELLRLPQDHPAAARVRDLVEEMRVELRNVGREIADLGPEYRTLIERGPAAKSLSLEGQGGALLLDLGLNELGWSRCYLVADRRIYLGAETLGYVVSKLLHLIDSEDAPILGEIDGVAVRGGLALAEAHHVLYASANLPELTLFCQGAHAGPVRLVGRITLSPEQRAEWSTKLTATRGEFERSTLWKYRPPV
jgi:hypothetical protein